MKDFVEVNIDKNLLRQSERASALLASAEASVRGIRSVEVSGDRYDLLSATVGSINSALELLRQWQQLLVHPLEDAEASESLLPSKGDRL
jgi:hypothetical protein